MCRLVFAAVALITIHTLCKDLASAEVKASPGPSRSLAMSAPKNTAPGTSLLRRVETCTAGMSSYEAPDAGGGGPTLIRPRGGLEPECPKGIVRSSATWLDRGGGGSGDRPNEVSDKH
jgi:hypothetical protein